MKVLVVHNDYQQAGGERTAVRAQVALLQRFGCEVRSYTRDNAEISHYSAWEKVLFFPRTIYSPRTAGELRALVRAERPDVAHVHNVFPLISPAAYRVLSGLGVPIVQTVHNFRFMCPNALFYTQGAVCERCKSGNMLAAVRFRCYRHSYLLSALYAATIALHRRWGTLERIDRFIALSSFAARKLEESGVASAEKITILPNFVSEPLPVVGSFAEREPYVVYLGRLAEEKGVATLIEAVGSLPGLGLKLLGAGPLLGPLRQRVAAAGFANVEFLGFVAGEAKWGLLRRATAVVIPSVCYEVLPFAALEALAVGTPLVVSKLGSLPELVDEGRLGLQFRPADAADLRDRLAWLLAHPEEARAMGRRGRETLERTCSERAHFDRLQALYAQLARDACGP